MRSSKTDAAEEASGKRRTRRKRDADDVAGSRRKRDADDVGGSRRKRDADDLAGSRRKRDADDLAGSRRKRDPVGMQRKILEAATEEFANHGFGGARVERISSRARTVDRMLYYYFGSKEKLFRAVLEEAYEKLGHAESQLQLASTPPLQGMRQLIAFTWDYYYLHPEFIRLLNSENQYRGQHLKKSSRVNQLSFPLLSVLRDLLTRGAQEGVFRDNVDPIQIYVTIAALGYFYLSNRYTLSRFLDRDLMADEHRRAWLDHITGVVLSFIGAR
jgi:AcrR family transcriptional regulator